MNQEEKTCSKCGEIKPISEYYRRGDRHRADCKACNNARKRAWEKANSEKPATWSRSPEHNGLKRCLSCDTVKSIAEFYFRNKKRGTRRNDCMACNNARKSAWKKANPERTAEQHRLYKERHRERINEKRRSPEGSARRRASDERCGDRIRAYREANKERLGEQYKAWYRANQAERIRQMRAWKQENREQSLAQNRAWKKANVDRCRAYKLERRALLQNAPGHATAEKINARIEYYGGKCWICGAPYEAIDHVKPLSKGGPAWPSNLRPICKFHNSAKRDAWPLEAVAARVEAFSL